MNGGSALWQNTKQQVAIKWSVQRNKILKQHLRQHYENQNADLHHFENDQTEVEKQPLDVFCKKGVLRNFAKSTGTPVPKPLF